jgi:transcription antitermination factor NusG
MRNTGFGSIEIMDKSSPPSKVLIDGDTILAVDGPLKDFKGKIVKVDKHKKRVWVEFEFDHMKQTVSLSIE